MPTETPSDAVLIHDNTPLLQPIQVSGSALMDLHEQTFDHLQDFVEAHFERFPQRALGGRLKR